MLLILMSLFLLFTGSFSASPTCKELFYHIIDDAASDVTVFCLVTVDIDAFGIQFDLHLFLQTATVIDQNKSRDSFYPIAVAACKNK